MKRALRYPSRWAGCWRTLGITAVLSVALGACSNFYGAREGTIEYPGSGAGPAAAAVYVVKDKDTVESVSQRYGVPAQTIIDRNRLIPPYTLRPGQYAPTAQRPVRARCHRRPPTTATATAPGPVKRETLPPPGTQGEPPRSAAPPAAGQPTPLSPAAAEARASPCRPRRRRAWPGRSRARSWCPTARPPAGRRTTASTSRPSRARR